MNAVREAATASKKAKDLQNRLLTEGFRYESAMTYDERHAAKKRLHQTESLALHALAREDELAWS